MKSLPVNRLVFALLLVLGLGAGCNRTEPPPDPIPAAELPAALEAAFAQAKPEAKTQASQVVALVRARDYPKAFAALQALATRPGLSKDQLRVVSGATLTVNSLLQEAQTQGDTKAIQTLENYRRDK